MIREGQIGTVLCAEDSTFAEDFFSNRSQKDSCHGTKTKSLFFQSAPCGAKSGPYPLYMEDFFVTDKPQNDLTIDQGRDDDTSESEFRSLSKDDVLRKLGILALALTGMIDDDNHKDITIDQIRAEIDKGRIFSFLEGFPRVKRGALLNLDPNVRAWLLSEWQSLQNATVPADFGIRHNGICLLLAYVIQSIQMRTQGDEPWPGPEP